MPGRGLTPRSVAIVDDDPAIRLALTRLVGPLGYAPTPFEKELERHIERATLLGSSGP